MALSETKRAPGVALVRGGDGPLYRQIYDQIRTAIALGQLRAGDRLPSTRDLAHRFGTARGTAEAAYAMLAGEGYIVSRRRAGTIVTPELDDPAVAAARPRLALRPQAPAAPAPRPFQLGVPAFDAFPRKLWSRLAGRRARAASAADMAYPDPAGYAPLREAIAGYLATSRGIACTPGQILITNGYQDALDLVCRVLLQPGDAVWFEDPGYTFARDVLESAGATLVPVRVDTEGLRVPDGVDEAPRARFALVTPSHQSPLGVTLSLPRRIALLAWARAAGAWIVEDDYDSEFRYIGRPLPALKGLDRDERVLYAGSFSKVLFPALRLGYLVLPDKLIAAFARASRIRRSGPPSFTQAVIADLMAEGHFARHLKRMRGLYAARRQALSEALVAVFGDHIAVELQPGGMHVIARLPDSARDSELARLARAGGFAVEALSSRAAAHACGQGLLLGFTNVAEADAPDLCHRLLRAIETGLDTR